MTDIQYIRTFINVFPAGIVSLFVLKTLFLQEIRNQIQKIYRKAPAAIIISSDTNKKGMHKDFHRADVEIAITHGVIMAAGLGMASCRMGLSEIMFNTNPLLKKKYDIPNNERVDGILAFGYSDTEWKRTPLRGPAKVIWKK